MLDARSSRLIPDSNVETGKAAPAASLALPSAAACWSAYSAQSSTAASAAFMALRWFTIFDWTRLPFSEIFDSIVKSPIGSASGITTGGATVSGSSSGSVSISGSSSSLRFMRSHTAETVAARYSGSTGYISVSLAFPATLFACLIAEAAQSSSLPPSSMQDLSADLATATHCFFCLRVIPFLCLSTSLTDQGIFASLHLFPHHRDDVQHSGSPDRTALPRRYPHPLNSLNIHRAVGERIRCRARRRRSRRGSAG